MKQTNEATATKETMESKKKTLSLRKPRVLKSGEALKELVSKKRVLPACESSSACSRQVK